MNIRSIPLTINPEPSMGVQTVFIEKETTEIFLNISSNNVFFLVLKEKKELSPWQILYNKLETYLSLHLEKHFIHIKICFLMDNNCNIIYQEALLLKHLVRPTTKEKISQSDMNTHETALA